MVALSVYFQMEAALKAYPKCNGLLVRGHGLYVWGDSWQQAKTQCECFDYLFETAVRAKALGVDVSQPPGVSRLQYCRGVWRICLYRVLFLPAVCVSVGACLCWGWGGGWGFCVFAYVYALVFVHLCYCVCVAVCVCVCVCAHMLLFLFCFAPDEI